jgi:hypothetical protein
MGEKGELHGLTYLNGSREGEIALLLIHYLWMMDEN